MASGKNSKMHAEIKRRPSTADDDNDERVFSRFDAAERVTQDVPQTSESNTGSVTDIGSAAKAREASGTAEQKTKNEKQAKAVKSQTLTYTAWPWDLERLDDIQLRLRVMRRKRNNSAVLRLALYALERMDDDGLSKLDDEWFASERESRGKRS